MLLPAYRSVANDLANGLLTYFDLHLLNDPIDARVKLEFETLSRPTDPSDVETGRFSLLDFLPLSTLVCLVVLLIPRRVGAQRFGLSGRVPCCYNCA